MPKKSVREMTKLERMRHSLSNRVFRSVLLGSVLLGVICLLIGLGLYTAATASRDISTAFHLSQNARAILAKTVDTEALSREVMTRYHSLSDQERADPYSDAYAARFADIYEREDYKTISSVLSDFKESSEVFAIYLAMYDEKTDAIVYIVDPESDPELHCSPGEWEKVDHEETEKFLHWDGSGMLYEIADTELYGWISTSGVPIKTDSGEVTGFILSDITLDDVVSGIWKFVVQFAVGVLIAIILFSILFLRRMKKTVVEPLNAIAQAAQQYTADKTAGLHNTGHFASLAIHTGDEIENLALTVTDMEYDLADYEKNLTQFTAEKQRIQTELTLANKIQADMLPNLFPAFPERDEFNIYASMTPAKEVGGDFYDFFMIDDDHLALVMADVSGKGVPAALFMMMTMIMIQNQAQTGKTPKEVLTSVNDQICRNNREQMFVTVWLGILEISTGKLIASNAGHEKPIVKHPEGNYEMVADKHGFVIGAMEGFEYRDYELQLQPGSRLFLYTDGLMEATDEANALFGSERTLETLNRAGDASPKALLEFVKSEVERFAGGAPQFDDLTMLCLTYNGTVQPDGAITNDQD